MVRVVNALDIIIITVVIETLEIYYRNVKTFYFLCATVKSHFEIYAHHPRIKKDDIIGGGGGGVASSTPIINPSDPSSYQWYVYSLHRIDYQYFNNSNCYIRRLE